MPYFSFRAPSFTMKGLDYGLRFLLYVVAGYIADGYFHEEPY